MTNIKQTIALDDSCILTTNDTSGFYDSVTNPNGFLPEANSNALAFNIYKLSHGYFLNVLLYNKYASNPVISNPLEDPYHVASVDTTYANNFTAIPYTLTQDGTYTLKRFFMPSLTFYNTNHTNAIYNGKDMYYTDGTDIFKVVSGTPTVIDRLLFATADLSNSDVITLSTSFISTCYTNSCYSKILNTLLDIDLGLCDLSLETTELLQKRDLLYMTLEVIKYLQYENNITQIQKLIEALDICGGLCTSVLQSNSDCNCNG